MDVSLTITLAGNVDQQITDFQVMGENSLELEEGMDPLWAQILGLLMTHERAAVEQDAPHQMYTYLIEELVNRLFLGGC